jgi:hypothetical protein
MHYICELDCYYFRKLVKMDYRTFFKNWKNWENFESRTDGINGVYAFRVEEQFGRIQGNSNILYIGKADQNPKRKKGIWYRLRNYRQDTKGASKRLKKIEEAFGGKSSIEYAYEICDDPRGTEKALLESYYEIHLEFPPLNRSA